MSVNETINGAYCGQPPAPSEWMGAWNMDWRLWLVLGAMLLAVRASAHPRYAVAGWVVLVVAFVSPLCALTAALFAARSVHHVLLVTIAAPLLGAAWPVWAQRLPAVWALLATLVLLVLWHVPQVYAWAWHSHAVYWGLQLGLLVSASVFWSGTFSQVGRAHEHLGQRALAPLAHVAILAGCMGLIGAVLTFADDVLYPQHGMAPLLYGLQPLQDQQLGALLMWVVGLLPLALIAACVLRQMWRQAAQPVQVAAG